MRPSVQIWTDGSSRYGKRGPGGWAAVLVAGQAARIVGGYSQETTNNEMETLAVAGALNALKKSCDVTLNTDSTYVILGLDKAMRGYLPATNEGAWGQVMRALERHTVRINKTKAHAFDYFNNLADVHAIYCSENRAELNEFYDDYSEVLHKAKRRK